MKRSDRNTWKSTRYVAVILCSVVLYWIVTPRTSSSGDVVSAMLPPRRRPRIAGRVLGRCAVFASMLPGQAVQIDVAAANDDADAQPRDRQLALEQRGERHRRRWLDHQLELVPGQPHRPYDRLFRGGAYRIDQCRQHGKRLHPEGRAQPVGDRARIGLRDDTSTLQRAPGVVGTRGLGA